MATTSIVNNGDAIVSEIYIAAPPDEVFRALVDPQLVIKWWGGQGAGQGFRCTHFECDLQPGGAWRSTGIDMQGNPFEASGKYIEVDPPHLLVQTWKASWAAEISTIVRWELRSEGSGTLVRHQHSGLSVHPEVAKKFRGWPQMLGWLQAFLEKGEVVESRWTSTTR